MSCAPTPEDPATSAHQLFFLLAYMDLICEKLLIFPISWLGPLGKVLLKNLSPRARLYRGKSGAGQNVTDVDVGTLFK